MSAIKPKGELREFLKDAEKLGWHFEGMDGNGHPRLHNPTTGDRYSAPLSPSDWRSRKNALADLKRIASSAHRPATSEEKAAMTAVEVFSYDQTKIRTVVISVQRWAVAADICGFLEIKDVPVALRRIDDDDKLLIRRSDTAYSALGIWDELAPQVQAVSLVSEGGATDLVLDSRKPEARQFRRFLTHTVWPSVRETGSYTLEPQLAMPTHSEALRGWADELERRQLAEAERDTALEWAAELESPASAWTTMVSDSVGDYEVADAAKVLSRDPLITIGRARLFSFMAAEGWIYRGNNRRWRAYQTQVDCGRIVEKIGHPFWHEGRGEMVSGDPTIRITHKGLEELRKRLGGNKTEPLALTTSSAGES